MLSLIQTLIFFLSFFLISSLVFYVVGFSVIATQKKLLKDQEIIALSLSLGMILFVLLAIILGLWNLRWLMLPLLLSACLLIILKYRWDTVSPWKIFVKDKLLLLLIVLGILVQGFINFPSGYLYKDGLHFWSSQGHDGLWHVSVMEAIKKSIPPQNPGFSGESLYNYHYLVDVLMGEFARIFPIFQSLDLYFRFFPVSFSLLIGISVFAFVSRWQENEQSSSSSKKIGYLAIIFTYFIGSFGYVVTFIKHGNLFAGETVFWAAQQNTILGNPPHAISHGLLATFFLSYLIYLKQRNLIWLVIAFLIGSILSGFKVSGGFVMLIGLGAASLIDFINKRKFSTLLLASSLALSNFVTFKVMTSKDAASFLMFLPWWFIRTMVVDKLDWIDLENRRQHYLSKGTWHANLRVIQLEITAFAIFLVGNSGMRILGIVELIRKFIFGRALVLKDPIEIMLVVTMLTGLIIPLLFVQKGLIYNNIQFMQYFLFIFGFFGAVSTYRILTFFESKIIKVIIVGFLISLSIPTVVGNLVEFYGPNTTPLAKITNMELAALNFLKENSPEDAIILNLPFNQYLKDKFKYQPRPIYAWYDTPYISALTGRSSYLASEHVTLLFYPGTDQRLENKRKFFEQSDFSWNREFLKRANISFIYIAKSELEKPLSVEENGLEGFFENDEVVIYRVKKV